MKIYHTKISGHKDRKVTRIRRRCYSMGQGIPRTKWKDLLWNTIGGGGFGSVTAGYGWPEKIETRISGFTMWWKSKKRNLYIKYILKIRNPKACRNGVCISENGIYCGCP